MHLPVVTSETCFQYEFGPLPYQSLLSVPKTRLFRPAAGYTVMKTFKLRKGHYPTAESLLKELKRVLGDQQSHAQWTYFESNNRFSVTVANDYNLRIHPRLASVLGFKTKDDNTYLDLKAGATYETEQTHRICFEVHITCMSTQT